MHWRMDLHLCERQRIFATRGNAGISRVLGRSDGQPNSCGEAAANDRESSTSTRHCVDVTGGLRDSALGAIANIIIRRNSFGWIVLWPNLSYNSGDCGRPLFQSSRNGLWTAVF